MSHEIPSRGLRCIPVLTVMSGPDVGKLLTIAAGQSLTIGRSEECGAVLADGSLSRIHARVDVVMGEYVLTDCGSRNGSFVNDVAVAGPVRLREGDRISLGRWTSMRFALVTLDEERALRGVYEASTKDGLTGAWNRRHTEERLDAELAFSLRHRAPLSVVMVDIDHFKQVNDEWGHQVGDRVLARTGRLIELQARETDVVARYGGEEFVVLLAGSDLGAAHSFAERVRDSLAAAHAPDMPVVRVSVGVDAGQAAEEVQVLQRNADDALYRAKRAGRDRTIIFQRAEPAAYGARPQRA